MIRVYKRLKRYELSKNMARTEVLEYIEGLGEVHRCYTNFATQLKNFRSDGIDAPVSVRDASYIRVNGYNLEYTRTCHAPICAKDSPTIVARVSPLVTDLKMAKKAVNAHRDNQYPVFDSDCSIYAQWEKIAKQQKRRKPENRDAIILSERGDFRV